MKEFRNKLIVHGLMKSRLLEQEFRHRGSLLLLPQAHGRTDGIRHRTRHQQRHVGCHQAGYRPLRGGSGQRVKHEKHPNANEKTLFSYRPAAD